MRCEGLAPARARGGLVGGVNGGDKGGGFGRSRGPFSGVFDVRAGVRPKGRTPRPDTLFRRRRPRGRLSTADRAARHAELGATPGKSSISPALTGRRGVHTLALVGG